MAESSYRRSQEGIDLGTSCQIEEPDYSNQSLMKEELAHVYAAIYHNEEDRSMRYQKNKASQLLWIVGDCPHLWAVHQNKPWISAYGVVKITESLLRGLGQVCFANNPWSGVLVLIGLIVASPLVGLASLVASITSLSMSKVLRQPDEAVVSGLQNYSAVLVGTVTASLFPVFFDSDMNSSVWGGIITMSAFSVCVGMGLGLLLSFNKLPVFTLPFNVTTSLLFLGFAAAGIPPAEKEVPNEALYRSINETYNVDWLMVMEGVLKSAGQVYAVESIAGSLLILLGLALNSPILALASFFGGLFGSMTGLLLNTPPYSAIHAGVWGYNGFLAAGCIAFFVSPSALSALLMALNAVFATFIQAGLVPIFSMNNLPVFTFPFCVSSLFFLVMVDAVPGVERVKDLSFPEKHWLDLRRMRRNSAYREPKDVQSPEVSF